MSEILLKNIEFPKEGTLTLLITSSGEVYRIPRKYYRNETVVITESKAVELPLHEDLIERTWLDDYASEFITEKDRRIGTYDWVEDMIEDAPTILEASEVSK